jgi:hypothetical protein
LHVKQFVFFSFGNFSGIFGVCTVKVEEKEETFLLVVDPHFWKSAKMDSEKMRQTLTTENWIQWKNLNEFMTRSKLNQQIYNFKSKSLTVGYNYKMEEKWH